MGSDYLFSSENSIWVSVEDEIRNHRLTDILRVSIAVVNRFKLSEWHDRRFARNANHTVSVRRRFHLQLRVQNILQGLCAVIAGHLGKAVHIRLGHFRRPDRMLCFRPGISSSAISTPLIYFEARITVSLLTPFSSAIRSQVLVLSIKFAFSELDFAPVLLRSPPCAAFSASYCLPIR